MNYPQGGLAQSPFLLQCLLLHSTSSIAHHFDWNKHLLLLAVGPGRCLAQLVHLLAVLLTATVSRPDSPQLRAAPDSGGVRPSTCNKWRECSSPPWLSVNDGPRIGLWSLRVGFSGDRIHQHMNNKRASPGLAQVTEYSESFSSDCCDPQAVLITCIFPAVLPSHLENGPLFISNHPTEPE